ncbi:hypothetical protein F4775DRAFT_186952 [Biscogniauxia sp. FL1348]|nr:hypothetical protein F4775DRAFT_186952 [Biscogniauxia sp. FL1348]
MSTTTTTIADLPNEILLSILHFLGTVDPQCLLLSQRTNTRFRALAGDVLFSPIPNPNSIPVPNPTATTTATPHSHNNNDEFLRARFAPLLDTAACFTPDEKKRAPCLSLDGDAALPFRRLPWAREARRRDAYLRPAASWRRLGLCLGMGMGGAAVPVRTLHVVKNYAAAGEGPDQVAYGQVDGGGGGGGGVALGTYFDMLLLSREGPQGGGEGALTYGEETGSWALLPRRGLRSFDVLCAYECFIPDDEALVARDESAAILFVQGGRGCSGPEREREDAWIERLVEQVRGREGGVGLKLLPWQGPRRERRSEDEGEDEE